MEMLFSVGAMEVLAKPPTAAVALHHSRLLLKDGSEAIVINKGLALEGWDVIDVAKRKCHTCPSGRFAACSALFQTLRKLEISCFVKV